MLMILTIQLISKMIWLINHKNKLLHFTFKCGLIFIYRHWLNYTLYFYIYNVTSSFDYYIHLIVRIHHLWMVVQHVFMCNVSFLLNVVLFLDSLALHHKRYRLQASMNLSVPFPKVWQYWLKILTKKCLQK